MFESTRLAQFLDTLRRSDMRHQHDVVINECLETHGLFEAPEGDTSHQWQLTLHGIAATGATEEEVVANWLRLARAALDRSHLRRPG